MTLFCFFGLCHIVQWVLPFPLASGRRARGPSERLRASLFKRRVLSTSALFGVCSVAWCQLTGCCRCSETRGETQSEHLNLCVHHGWDALTVFLQWIGNERANKTRPWPQRSLGKYHASQRPRSGATGTGDQSPWQCQGLAPETPVTEAPGNRERERRGWKGRQVLSEGRGAPFQGEGTAGGQRGWKERGRAWGGSDCRRGRFEKDQACCHLMVTDCSEGRPQVPCSGGLRGAARGRDGRDVGEVRLTAGRD